MTTSKHEPHNHPSIPVMWTIMLAGFAGFLIIAAAVHQGILGGIDRQLLLSMRSATDISDPLGPPWFEEMAAETTALGGYTLLVLFGALAVILLMLFRHFAAAAFLLLALLSGTALSTGLKFLFARPRPDLVDHLDRTFTSSFPSGHATVSMLAYLTLAAVAIRFVPKHSVRVFIVWASIIIAVLIGVSRVYLGVHWPSDVLAGWFLGTGWATMWWLIAHYYTEKTSNGTAELGHSET